MRIRCLVVLALTVSAFAANKHKTLTIEDELSVKEAHAKLLQIALQIQPLQIQLEQAKQNLKAAVDKALRDAGMNPEEVSLDLNTWQTTEIPKPQPKKVTDVPYTGRPVKPLPPAPPNMN